ncbi:MAG: hypothetical protein E7062_10645, partial [Spirochaetaceae bacterium]|nr:hypothetical protein [Spirochaetaceae bacterium]
MGGNDKKLDKDEKSTKIKTVMSKEKSDEVKKTSPKSATKATAEKSATKSSSKSTGKTATKKAAVYDESKIKTLSPLEHIRLRTGMYIGRLGDGTNQNDGIYILLKEVIDNSID